MALTLRAPALRLALLGLAVLPGCGAQAAPPAHPTAGATAAAPAIVPGPSRPPSPRARCDASEQLAVHSHAHLTVLDGGVQREVSANVGLGSGCIYWLHTHDRSGVIHIEAPASQSETVFTLGDFFDVWGQPLDSTHVANLALSPSQTLVVFVDGQRYGGDPRSVPLRPHAEITLEITPPLVDPPPVYSFPANY